MVIKFIPGAKTFKENETSSVAIESIGTANTSANIVTQQTTDTTYTLIDTNGVNPNIVLTEGNFTINGKLTLTDTITTDTIITNAIDNPTTLCIGNNAPIINFGCSTNTTNINIGANNSVAKTINIGTAGDIVNIGGTVNSVQSNDLIVSNRTITLNDGGENSSAFGVGIVIEEGGVITSYISTSSDRTQFAIKAPANAGILYSPAITTDTTIATTADLVNYSTVENPTLSGIAQLTVTGTDHNTINYDEGIRIASNDVATLTFANALYSDTNKINNHDYSFVRTKPDANTSTLELHENRRVLMKYSCSSAVDTVNMHMINDNTTIGSYTIGSAVDNTTYGLARKSYSIGFAGYNDGDEYLGSKITSTNYQTNIDATNRAKYQSSKLSFDIANPASDTFEILIVQEYDPANEADHQLGLADLSVYKTPTITPSRRYTTYHFEASSTNGENSANLFDENTSTDIRTQDSPVPKENNWFRITFKRSENFDADNDNENTVPRSVYIYPTQDIADKFAGSKIILKGPNLYKEFTATNTLTQHFVFYDSDDGSIYKSLRKEHFAIDQGAEFKVPLSSSKIIVDNQLESLNDADCCLELRNKSFDLNHAGMKFVNYNMAGVELNNMMIKLPRYENIARLAINGTQVASVDSSGHVICNELTCATFNISDLSLAGTLSTDGNITVGQKNNIGTINTDWGALSSQYKISFPSYRDVDSNYIGATIATKNYNTFYGPNNYDVKSTSLEFSTVPNFTTFGIFIEQWKNKPLNLDLIEFYQANDTKLVLPASNINISSAIGDSRYNTSSNMFDETAGTKFICGDEEVNKIIIYTGWITEHVVKIKIFTSAVVDYPGYENNLIDAVVTIKGEHNTSRDVYIYDRKVITAGDYDDGEGCYILNMMQNIQGNVLTPYERLTLDYEGKHKLNGNLSMSGALNIDNHDENILNMENQYGKLSSTIYAKSQSTHSDLKLNDSTILNINPTKFSVINDLQAKNASIEFGTDVGATDNDTKHAKIDALATTSETNPQESEMSIKIRTYNGSTYNLAEKVLIKDSAIELKTTDIQIGASDSQIEHRVGVISNNNLLSGFKCIVDGGNYLTFHTHKLGGTIGERMRITPSGEVGIGTTTVDFGVKLQIAGITKSYAHIMNSSDSVESLKQTLLRVENPNLADTAETGFYIGKSTVGTYNGAYVSYGNSAIHISVDDVQRLNINDERALLNYDNNTTSTSYIPLRIQNESLTSDSTIGIYMGKDATGSNNGAHISYGNSSISVNLDGAEELYITSNEIDVKSNRIANVADPTDSHHAVNKSFLDGSFSSRYLTVSIRYKQAGDVYEFLVSGGSLPLTSNNFGYITHDNNPIGYNVLYFAVPRGGYLLPVATCAGYGPYVIQQNWIHSDTRNGENIWKVSLNTPEGLLDNTIFAICTFFYP